jgi:hypothetical protein
MDAAPGYSIWIVIFLSALLFVVLWGILAAFLSLGTWFIVRNLPEEDSRAPRDQWQDPRDP